MAQDPHVVPDTTRSRGPVAADEALPHQGAQHLIGLAAQASGLTQLGIDAAARDTERHAYQSQRRDDSLLIYKVESHIDSLVKQSAASFRYVALHLQPHRLKLELAAEFPSRFHKPQPVSSTTFTKCL